MDVVMSCAVLLLMVLVTESVLVTVSAPPELVQ